MEKQANGAEKMLESHQLEIQRRSSAAADTNTINPPRFPRSKSGCAANLPFKDEIQKFVLFSVSHVAMPPVSKDPQTPAIRFYGTFASEEEAIDHASEVRAVDASVNIQLCPTHTWSCLSASQSRLNDHIARQQHIDAVLEEYRSQRNKNCAEFKDNVANKKGGAGLSDRETSNTERRKKAALEAVKHVAETPSEGAELGKSKKLSRSAEIRGQSFIVVSFLADKRQDLPEPLFKVYCTFDTEELADLYVRNTAGDEEKDFDIVNVDLYEWLFPQDVENVEPRNTVYRSAELGKIMDNHTSQPAQVKAYKRWREQTQEQEQVQEKKQEHEQEQEQKQEQEQTTEGQ